MRTPSQPAPAVNRRAFLAALAAAALRAQSPDARVEVLVNEPIARTAPEIYGHFVEHLGAVVYDGIWVGEASRIPNVRGVRKDLLDALRTIRPSVIHWPGGCFADQYDWRDGGGSATLPCRQHPQPAGAGVLALD